MNAPHSPNVGIMALKSGIFKPNGPLAPGSDWPAVFLSAECPYNAAATIVRGKLHATAAAAEFGIAEARRVLGEVFAPWVHGSQSVDRGFRLSPAGRIGRLAAGRDPAPAVLGTAVPQWRHGLAARR